MRSWNRAADWLRPALSAMLFVATVYGTLTGIHLGQPGSP